MTGEAIERLTKILDKQGFDLKEDENGIFWAFKRSEQTWIQLAVTREV